MQDKPSKRLERQFDIIVSNDNHSIIKDFIPPVVSENSLEWRNDVGRSDLRSIISGKYFGYCSQYLAFFKNRSYQFLFNDYSLGRLRYSFNRQGKLLSYNLFWYPCPFNVEFVQHIRDNQLDTMEYIDAIDNHEKILLENILLRTPIRLDYDSEYNDMNYRYHPLSHVHLQNKDTRMKMEKVLSVYGYYLFILENCYPYEYRHIEESSIDIIRKLDFETKHWLKISSESKSENGVEIKTMISRS